MRIFGKIEGLERQSRAGCLIDGVLALLRHRSMRGDASRGSFEPEDALVPGEKLIGGWLSDDDGPAREGPLGAPAN